MADWAVLYDMTIDPFIPRRSGHSTPTPSPSGGVLAIATLFALLFAIDYPIILFGIVVALGSAFYRRRYGMPSSFREEPLHARTPIRRYTNGPLTE